MAREVESGHREAGDRRSIATRRERASQRERRRGAESLSGQCRGAGSLYLLCSSRGVSRPRQQVHCSNPLPSLCPCIFIATALTDRQYARVSAYRDPYARRPYIVHGPRESSLTKAATMLALQCPAQNYAWGRPAEESEVRVKTMNSHKCDGATQAVWRGRESARLGREVQPPMRRAGGRPRPPFDRAPSAPLSPIHPAGGAAGQGQWRRHRRVEALRGALVRMPESAGGRERSRARCGAPASLAAWTALRPRSRR